MTARAVKLKVFASVIAASLKMTAGMEFARSYRHVRKQF